VRWAQKEFGELTATELYALLRLRQEVFVVEQRCPYLDADGLDAQAMHLWAVDGAKPLAYARLFAPGVRAAEAVIGRVVTAPSVRGTGVGCALMERALAVVAERHHGAAIRIGAQKYLQHFYESFGFVRDGDDYLDDGIPHLPMRRPPP
jgi:ElaA protein